MAERFNQAAFDKSIADFVKKANGNVLGFAVALSNRIATELVIRTPGPGNSVAKDPPRRGPTGFLRGSWFASIGSPPRGTGSADKTGGTSLGRVSTVASGLQLGQVFYLGNTASYAARVNWGFVGTDSLGRHYNQAGRYWVEGVINDAPRIAKEVAEQIASGKTFRPTGGISNGRFTAGPASR